VILNNGLFMGELDPETAALYARQAAAAAGAGRAAEAASAAASTAGREQEQAQAAVMEHAAAVASGSIRPWYAGKGLLFVGLGAGGLLLYLAMRSPSRPAVYYSRPRPRK
jgi:hypothetical protein